MDARGERRVDAIAALVIQVFGYSVLFDLYVSLESPDSTADLPNIELAWAVSAVVVVEAAVSIVCCLFRSEGRPRVVQVMDMLRWGAARLGSSPLWLDSLRRRWSYRGDG